MDFILDMLGGSYFKIGAVVAGIIALVALYYGIRASGRREAEAEQMRRRVRAAEKAREIERETELDPLDLKRKEMKEWAPPKV